MKTLILFFVLFVSVKAQMVPTGSGCTIYEVTPGTKGNQIILSVVNQSETTIAEEVGISLIKSSEALVFNENEKTINKIDPKAETEASFSFDVKRNAAGSKKDTIEFEIRNNNGIYTKKQFIISYASPKDYKLEQNFPNPFNPVTTIQYQLHTDSKVTLKIYDILGSEVTTLVDEFQDAGYKEIKFNASSLASGIYVYRLTSDNFISVKKMILLR